VRELKNPWILRLCESHYYLRLQGIPAFKVVPPETLSARLPDYSEYRAGIPAEKYRDVAKKLGVPYVLFLHMEYSPFVHEGQVSVGREATFFGDLHWVPGDSSVAIMSTSFPLEDLGPTLDAFLVEMLDALEIPEEKRNKVFLGSAITMDSKMSLRKLGKYLAEPEACHDETKAFRIEAGLNRLFAKERNLVLGYYASSWMFAEAEKYESAARMSYAVVNRLRDQFPPGYVTTARLYRLAGKCSDAIEMLDEAKGLDLGIVQEELDHEREACEGAATEASAE
jgi:hypothetical protein